MKDSKVLAEDLSAGVRHHLLKSSALAAIKKSLDGELSESTIFRPNFDLFSNLRFYGENADSGVWDSLGDDLQEKLVCLYGGGTSDGISKVRDTFQAALSTNRNVYFTLFGYCMLVSYFTLLNTKRGRTKVEKC